MFDCKFCGGVNNNEDADFDMDRRGYWCQWCDGFNFILQDDSNHRFTLILEEKCADKKLYTLPEIKLSKRLSPYRYPGGKSKVIDYLYSHLRNSKSNKLVSPFTGGGSFELAMLDSGAVQELHLNDLDPGVFSLWWTIKHFPSELICRLETIVPTHDDYFMAQQIIKNDYSNVNIIDAAWASLVVNRLAFSGIYKSNPLGGRKGNKAQLLSRWNPLELIRRIKFINNMSDKITISQEKAADLIEESYWNESSTIFIDPPYVAKGKDLYHCYYSKQEHVELSVLLDTLHKGFPGADMIVTYDFCEFISKLYITPKKEIVGRIYSL